MMYDRTDNEIKYHYYSTGPQGERFELFPVIGINTENQVKESKAQLRREQNVVKIYTHWIDEDEWKKMKIHFHSHVVENDFLNKKYHELYKQIYET